MKCSKMVKHWKYFLKQVNYNNYFLQQKNSEFKFNFKRASETNSTVRPQHIRFSIYLPRWDLFRAHFPIILGSIRFSNCKNTPPPKIHIILTWENYSPPKGLFLKGRLDHRMTLCLEDNSPQLGPTKICQCVE